MLIYYNKYFYIDFKINSSVLNYERNNSYDLIIIFVKKLNQIIHYKQVKIRINIINFAKIIIDIVIRQENFLGFI